MKKAKYLVLSTALATMLLGAGYAAWTDDFTIKNTVDTGEFKVILQGNAGASYDATFKNPEYYNLEQLEKDGVEVGSEAQALKGQRYGQSVQDNTVSFEFKNLYPGSEGKYAINAYNDGTLPAVIESVEVSEIIGYKDGVKRTLGNLDLDDAIEVDFQFSIGPESHWAPRFSKRLTNVPLGELETRINDLLKGQYILPDEMLQGTEEELYHNMTFRIPADSLNGDEGENEMIQFDMKFNFVQHNMYEGGTEPTEDPR